MKHCATIERHKMKKKVRNIQLQTLDSAPVQIITAYIQCGEILIDYISASIISLSWYPCTSIFRVMTHEVDALMHMTRY